MDDPEVTLNLARADLDRLAGRASVSSNYGAAFSPPQREAFAATCAALAAQLRAATTLDAVGDVLDALSALDRELCHLRKGLRMTILHALAQATNALRAAYAYWYIDRNLPAPPGPQVTRAGVTPYSWTPKPHA